MSMRTKVLAWSAWCDHLADDVLGEGGIEVHAHLGELYADVGVEVALLDGVEKLVVDVGGGAGFGLVMTLSPRESRRDGDAFGLTRWQAARASSTDMPATKRPESLWPMEDRSEKERSSLF